MKKRAIASLVGILLIPLSLAGCSTHGKQLSDVQKISYIGYCGDQDCGTVLVITSDRKVKQYDITWDYKYPDLFAGKLPSEDKYNLTEYQISEEEWNALINALDANSFMELPEDISVEGFDMPTSHIQVETADGVHKSGGYGAAYGDEDANKRFHAVQEELYKIKKADWSPPRYYWQ